MTKHNWRTPWRCSSTGVPLACLISSDSNQCSWALISKVAHGPEVWVSSHLNSHPFLLFWRWNYLLYVCSSRLFMTDNNADECQVSFTWLCLQDPPENPVQNLCKKVTCSLHVFKMGFVYCWGILSLLFLRRDFKVLLSARAGIPQHRTVVVMPNVVCCSLHI